MAAVPAGNSMQFANRPVHNQLTQALKIRVGVTLGAVLRDYFVLVLEIIRADRADFVHADAQRLFAVDVDAAIDRPIDDEGVVVIRRADDDGFNVLRIQTLAPVPVGLGLGKNRQGFLNAEIVCVAQRYHVLIPEDVVVHSSPAPHADEGDIQPVAGGLLPSQHTAFQNSQSDCGGSRGFEQITSLHAIYNGTFRRSGTGFWRIFPAIQTVGELCEAKRVAGASSKLKTGETLARQSGGYGCAAGRGSWRWTGQRVDVRASPVGNGFRSTEASAASWRAE